MAKLTAEHLVAGAKIWMAGYSRITKKQVPLELKVVTGKLVEGIRFHVHYANATEHYIIGPSYSVTEDEPDFWVYLGDKGIRPYNYDSRPTQLFTTREEMQAAINLWDGKNPNSMIGD